MSNETSSIDSKWPYLPMAIFAALLIIAEVIRIRQNYLVIETYAPNDDKLQAAVDWLAWAHCLRIVLISTIFIKWRWALWLIGAAYLAPYIPNPWVTGPIMNSLPMLIFYVPLAVLAAMYAPQYVTPWQRRESTHTHGGGDS